MVGAIPVNFIPKFCNEAMENHNNNIDHEEININVGDRIKSQDDFGTVKYIGEISGYKGTWYGIEWDNILRGKHSGSVDGIEYFKTDEPNSGSFIRPNKISPVLTCADAIKKYYGDREDETVAAHRRTVINEWKREMGAPFIEMVGFEKVHQKQVKFDSLTEVCVSDLCISKAGNLSDLCPNVESLDVSRNLFSKWREVVHLTAQLPNLQELNLSNNRMAIDLSEETMALVSKNFKHLEKISLSKCEYEWKDILSLIHLFPQIKEMTLAYNRITKIIPPYLPENMGIFPKNGVFLNGLTVLKLDGNPLESWDEVKNLGFMTNLQILSLNECGIKNITFDEEKIDYFQKLEVLFLNRNDITDWRSISELDKMKNLRKLYFLKNPLHEGETYDTIAQLIVARIGSLQELNGSQVTREFRRGADYDYLYRHGAQWKEIQSNPAALEQFRKEHCRFQSLIDKYGVPEDSLLEKQPKHKSLTSKLIEINLQDEIGKKYKKKFPSTMMVQKLATLVMRIFPKSGKGLPDLFCLDPELNREILLENTMKDLNFYSVRNGDTILVRWR